MKLLKIIGIVLALLLVALVALPFLIDVNSFRPRIESELSSTLGRKVTIGNLKLSILSGGVGADNIAIGDDPAFSNAAFISANSLKVGVEMMPLIFHKQLNVTEITLQQPEIILLKASNGKWNFSSIAAASSQTPSKPDSSAPALSVGKLKITDGKLIVGAANSSVKPQVYDKANIEITNFSFTSQFPFEVKVHLLGGGDVDISGKAGPIDAADAAKTPFEASAKVDGLDIGTSGFIDPASGIAGLADFDGTLSSNGTQATAIGKFTGSKLKLSKNGTPSPKTVVITHNAVFDLNKQSGTLTQGDVAIGKAIAHLTGTFQIQGQSQIVNMKLDAPDMSVDELEAMLPSLGVVLPSGSQLKGGTLSTNLAISGPLDKLVITGPVRLANTKLAGFDMGSKLGALSSFAGKAASNPDTSIQNVSLNARVTPDGTKADNINLTVPAIGVITGAGNVSGAGALDFKMLADLKGGVANDITQVTSFGSGKGGIPFSIDGTTANPHFVPDMKGIAGNVAKNVLGNVMGGQSGQKNNPTDAIMGLFGKKKK